MNSNGSAVWYKSPGWWILAIVLALHIYVTDRKVTQLEDKVDSLMQRAILRDR